MESQSLTQHLCCVAPTPPPFRVTKSASLSTNTARLSEPGRKSKYFRTNDQTIKKHFINPVRCETHNQKFEMGQSTPKVV